MGAPTGSGFEFQRGSPSTGARSVRRRRRTAAARRRRHAARLALAMVVISAISWTSSPAPVVEASPGQSVTDLASGATATQLAQALVGEGVSITNVSYTGDPHAAGSFSGMGAVGIDSGVVLSSGSISTDPATSYTSSVLGPNVSDGVSASFGTPGDANLDALVAPETTNDASVLEFDFVPSTSQVTFNYVFGSDEYNEYVGSFNDVFAFFINGTNCATIGGQPVSVNNINAGTNPSLFRDNDLSDPGQPSIDTEMDGLTTVLACTATVTPNVTSHIKLAIADTSDSALDSDVFLEGGSFRANNPPVANADAYTAAPGVTLTVPAPGILANDTDPDGDPLQAQLVTGSAHGLLTLNPDGSFAYFPANGYSGPDSFTYTASDGVAGSPPATVSISVGAPNGTPSAVADHFTTAEDAALHVPAPGVLGNDSDPESDPLTALFNTAPAHGTLTLNADGSFDYVPAPNFNGQDSFQYAASDGSSATPATVTIDVSPAPDAPVAMDDSYNTQTGTALTIGAPGVLGNDADPDAETLAATPLSTPTHGTLTLDASGAFTYTPEPGFLGSDSFTYRATDPTGLSSTATATINVGPLNTAPDAAGDQYTVVQGTTLSVPPSGVLANDTDPQGDSLIVADATAPTHGSVNVNANGGFDYTPLASFVGVDSFTYRASDGSLLSPAATVTITVLAAEPPAPPPVPPTRPITTPITTPQTPPQSSPPQTSPPAPTAEGLTPPTRATDLGAPDAAPTPVAVPTAVAAAEVTADLGAGSTANTATAPPGTATNPTTPPVRRGRAPTLAPRHLARDQRRHQRRRPARLGPPQRHLRHRRRRHPRREDHVWHRRHRRRPQARRRHQPARPRATPSRRAMRRRRHPTRFGQLPRLPTNQPKRPRRRQRTRRHPPLLHAHAAHGRQRPPPPPHGTPAQVIASNRAGTGP